MAWLVLVQVFPVTRGNNINSCMFLSFPLITPPSSHRHKCICGLEVALQCLQLIFKNKEEDFYDFLSSVHEKKVYNMPLQYNPLFCSFTVFVLDQVDDDQVDFNEMLS